MEVFKISKVKGINIYNEIKEKEKKRKKALGEVRKIFEDPSNKDLFEGLKLIISSSSSLGEMGELSLIAEIGEIQDNGIEYNIALEIEKSNGVLFRKTCHGTSRCGIIGIPYTEPACFEVTEIETIEQLKKAAPPLKKALKEYRGAIKRLIDLATKS